jgi:hypothetical protein
MGQERERERLGKSEVSTDEVRADELMWKRERERGRSERS